MAPFVLLGFFALYILLFVLLFRWARIRRQRRAQGVADALAGAGAKVGSVHGTPGLWKPAVIDLTLEGRAATFEIRPYSRDFDLLSISVPSRPLPHVLIRRERASDRLGKQLGFNREVQIGDPAFDQAAYIDTAESDQVVHALLDRPDVRAAVLAVLATGYGVEMSPGGLRATLVQPKIGSIDTAAVPRAVAAIEALASILPEVHPSSIGQPHWQRSAASIYTSLGGLMTGFLITGVCGPFVHPFVELRNAIYGALVGLALWIAAVAVLFFRLRGGSTPFSLLVMGAVVLLVSVPLAGAMVTFVANSALDGSPAVTHETRVVALPRNPRKSRRVTFEGWRPGAGTVNADIPRSRLSHLKVGDHAVITTHAGAFGWEWVDGVSF